MSSTVCRIVACTLHYLFLVHFTFLLMESIHNRMPVILPPSRWDEWLDPDNHDTEALEHLLRPAPASEMKARRVSTRVNNARNEGPDCQAPFESDES